MNQFITFRDSLSRKLTAMNMLVSGLALVLASIAFFAYDLFTFRANLITSTSTQAKMIGANAVSPLIFDDAQAAQATLSALRASEHVVYAGIYSAGGTIFAGYWRDQSNTPAPLPVLKNDNNEQHWFESGQFVLVQPIIFQNKPVGTVYIRSDLQAIYARLKTYSLILLIILLASLVAALALSRILQRVISPAHSPLGRHRAAGLARQGLLSARYIQRRPRRSRPAGKRLQRNVGRNPNSRFRPAGKRAAISHSG